MRVAVVGFGFVGKAIHCLFPEAVVFDPKLLMGSKEQVNECDVAFVCVPTNMKQDGSCDTSIVEEVVGWLETPLIIIRSTVVPGTTAKLQDRHPNKRIVFQPEYVGETTAHPLLNESERTFIILGGHSYDCAKAVQVYQTVYNASVRFCIMNSIEAEIVKYMENTSIAATVTLCNEFYNICQSFGVSYDRVREAYLLDPRMSRYFTFVFPDERGFGGKCLPKDLNAIVVAARNSGYEPEFIKAILENNDRIKEE